MQSFSKTIAQKLVRQDTTVEDVLKALTSYNLLPLLPAILKSVQVLSRNDKKLNTLRIETPFPLSKGAVTNIQSFVGEKDVDHEVVINKSILSGFKAKLRNRVYDGSGERIVKALTEQK